MIRVLSSWSVDAIEAGMNQYSQEGYYVTQFVIVPPGPGYDLEYYAVMEGGEEE